MRFLGNEKAADLRNAGGDLQIEQAGKRLNSQLIPFQNDPQQRRLAFIAKRVALPPAVARVVAEVAFGRRA